MRHITLCAAMFVVGICVSCTNHPPRTEAALGDLISGGTAEEREFARAALGELPRVVREVAEEIRITNDCSGFTSRFIVGFHHRGGPICVREGRVTRAVVWHEPAHTHFHTLSRAAQEQWEGFVDDDLFHGEGINIVIPGAYPSRGMITSYGGTNPRENYAEWVTWLTHYLRGYGSGYGRADIASIDRRDPVYLAILTFFRAHDVLTEEEFRRVQPLFAE
ncbi:MAG: hypothetical protein Q7R85_00830 [bacterium]|nr:hypothetical protein [bacterium]